jgi:type II secretory pathway pseudopilin PulG
MAQKNTPQAGQSNPLPQQQGGQQQPPQQDPNAQAQQQQAAQQQAQQQAAQQQQQAAQQAAQQQGQQGAQLSPQHVQALSQVQPQHLQRAAQFGEEIQRAGFDMGTFFKIATLAQKYGPQLTGLFSELQSLFGGGGTPPEGQAQTK